MDQQLHSRWCGCDRDHLTKPTSYLTHLSHLSFLLAPVFHADLQGVVGRSFITDSPVPSSLWRNTRSWCALGAALLLRGRTCGGAEFGTAVAPPVEVLGTELGAAVAPPVEVLLTELGAAVAPPVEVVGTGWSTTACSLSVDGPGSVTGVSPSNRPARCN